MDRFSVFRRFICPRSMFTHGDDSIWRRVHLCDFDVEFLFCSFFLSFSAAHRYVHMRTLMRLYQFTKNSYTVDGICVSVSLCVCMFLLASLRTINAFAFSLSSLILSFAIACYFSWFVNSWQAKASAMTTATSVYTCMVNGPTTWITYARWDTHSCLVIQC